MSCSLISLVILLMMKIIIIMIVPIDVTLVGIAMDVREVRANAESPFIVDDSSSNSKQSSGNSYGLKMMMMLIIPINVTLVGIVTDVREVH